MKEDMKIEDRGCVASREKERQKGLKEGPVRGKTTDSES
jgi:hypothetical protein